MRRFILLLAACPFLFGQPSLRFKVPPARELVKTDTRSASVASPVPFGKGHVIVQFADGAMDRGVAALRARGAEVLADVPDNAVLVAVQGSLDLAGLDAVYAAPLAAEQKLSPELNPGTDVYVVEFHRDVTLADARRAILDSRLELREHPDLAPYQLLAAQPGRLRASSGLRTLAQRDEVAYIFPASRELASGLPAVACEGALTENGEIGQYISTIGNGWDGAGLNAVTLRYVFGAASTQAPTDQTRAEILRAMQEWTRAAAIAWQPGESATAPRTVNIEFGRGQHGDRYPFDGRGRVLAHTFYPAPPNSEPLAGDMHFDDDEPWRIGVNMDVFSVALHELGHALGLGHSDHPGAVMYPYYRMVSALSTEDIQAIQGMYAAPGEQTPSGPPTTPPAGPTTPSNPAPPATPPVTPTPGDTTAPALVIVSPSATVTTSAATRLFAGTASDASGIASVTWSTSLGASGTAQGTTSWQAEIPLLKGYNTVTIRATDGAGNTAWRSVLVVRR